jgi:hypothetical protein
MAYSTIPKSSSYFNTVTYTGNGTASTALTTGTFQPDFCWFKNRGTIENHVLIDAIRGASYNLASNLTRAETNVPDKVSAFTSTGVTLGGSAETNENNEPLVAWNWKANGSGSANSDGSINSTVSVDTTSGFSIVTYTGTNTLGATVGHGLGVAPKMIIVKSRTGAGENWNTYHESLGATKFINLNTDNSVYTDVNAWNNTAPTASVFSIGGNSGDTGRSGSDYVAYCFADIQGYSKFGSYVGNGNADGSFVYTGFKPAFVIFKRSSDSTENWMMLDNERSPFNVANKRLSPNLNAAENTDIPTDFLSNGFKIRTSGGGMNASGVTYIYAAFGQPIVSTNGDIATAR